MGKQVYIRSSVPLHLSSTSLERITAVAIWKLLFYSRQYHPDLWVGDLQWAMLQCLGAEVKGTAALLEVLIDEVPKKPQQELSLILFPNKS